MIHSIKDVLSTKKGVAEALGITLVGVALLTAASVVVANYAIVSKQAGQLQTLTQAITNRAEVYASNLNTDLVTPQVPSMALACTTTPSMCTTIISATPSPDGTRTVLRIKGDVGATASAFNQTVTKDLTLESQTVTHVTELDPQGNRIWALSDEGNRYKVWGLASGEPSVVKAADLAGPTAGTSWVSVDDRAGIDSTGALWVWGANNIGQAGVGAVSAAAVVPKKIVITGNPTFRSVVTGDDRGYAIDSTGVPWVWGKNTLGQLGLGHANQVLVPTKIPGKHMMTFAIGKDNVFGITMAGDLTVVGASQAGLPANTGVNTQVITPGTQYRAVAAAATGAVAMIDSTGKMTMAGNAYPFTPYPGGIFNSVSLGATAGYAMGTNGVIYAWGNGANGQLGMGSTTSVSTPTAIPGPKFTEVSGGKTSAFAIDVSGKLYYFGKTPAGAAGGPELPQVNVPTKLLAESRFRETAANNGDTSVALLDTAGNVYGLGTPVPGLWPTAYSGANNQPVRMPVPAGFSSNTWG